MGRCDYFESECHNNGNCKQCLQGKNTGCDCCAGDEPVIYKDSDNCVFVDSKGELFVSVKGHIIRGHVDYCPKCGRKFEEG